MKITSQMIADRCGVSRGTVDRVVNGRANVAPEVRARVQRIIDELGYRTPAQRRQARPAQQGATIGFIIPAWGDYYIRQTRRGIQSALRRIGDAGFRVEAREMRGRSNQEYCACIAALEAAQVDGLVLNAADTAPMEQEINRLAEAGVPVVTCNSDVPGSARVCHVGQDLVKSGRVAAGLLVPVLSGGDVLIVCGNREFTAHRLRVEGFLDRLYELEGDIGHAHVIECIERYDLTYDGVLREVRRNPRLRAIYMANESVKGCMDALSRARAPQPIHVVCNDLTPYAREYLSDGRVDFVIDQDFSGQARRAVEVLYDLVCRGRMPADPVIHLRTSIISRELL
ncbi:MAG TPA: LacI family DNA-binding transcriptional regulator [Candidatus Butyricicoccus avicola]|nr:LacI family DNA-binding transcriptional regulator [Candidatus Butyricicoccus avicola]